MRIPTAIFASALAVLVLSCQTTASQEARLAPPRSTVEIRLDEIRRQLDENPVRAIDLIHTYREIYRVTEGYEREDELLAMEATATENLRGFLERAVAEERWDTAISLGRSLANVERTDISQWEPGFTLAFAQKSLEDGDNINAFLSAARAHEMRPLTAAEAMPFLLRAFEGRQRGTASFFYAIVAGAGAAATVPAEVRAFAVGSDTPADMLRGVATVIVDRGFRTERGRIQLDRVGGSAFFIDAGGLLITNYHVISSEVDPTFRGNSRMFIRLGDSTSPRIPARVIGWDKTLDLALISAPVRSDFAFSVIDRTVPGIGETILAIGSPVGLEHTVTSGIVSAMSRRFLQIGDVMQIDASVNPGNSGGPVVDTSGRLVGVVFAGIMQAQGLNFAIPAERLAAALPAMTRGGRAERPWLGTVLSETFNGAEIIYTAPGTPVSRHRVPEGSIIRAVNGTEIRAAQGQLIPVLQDSVFQLRPGELVAIETVERNGEVRRRLMMTAPRPELPLMNAARNDSRERLATPFFGMVLAPGGGRGRAFQVERVVRGFVADEVGVSENDRVAIRNFRVFEREGFVLMEMNIQKRNMGFMETTMQLFALVDSPDTF